MTLADQGWRFVYRHLKGWTWMHPADVTPDDIDGTEMSDEDFTAVVKITVDV